MELSPVSVRLLQIVGSLFTALCTLSFGLERSAPGAARWLPPSGSKRSGDLLALALSPLWIASVVVVIAGGFYERWGRWGYLAYCVSCAAPYVALPLLWPCAADRGTPWHDRYATKANAWVGLFSFVGNYWYTHYFYRVLGARYTFDAHELNGVPLCLYFMTHAYFMLYHTLASAALRRLRTGYAPGWGRATFGAALVAAMAYVTALTEAVTIVGFPYYSFADRDAALTVGSAFYGIYFIVSYPAFARIDEAPAPPAPRARGEGAQAQARGGAAAAAAAQQPPPPLHFSLGRACAESLASGMAVLCLLDFVRLALGVPLFAPT